MPQGRKRHPVFARWYAKMSPGMDAGGMAGYRQRALAGLTGSVIEVGAGNGLNFSHYPPEVTRVLAIEPAPYLLQLNLPRSWNNGEDVPFLMLDHDAFCDTLAWHVAGIRSPRGATRSFMFKHLVRHALCLEELLQRDGDTHGFLLSVADATTGREKVPR